MEGWRGAEEVGLQTAVGSFAAATQPGAACSWGWTG